MAESEQGVELTVPTLAGALKLPWPTTPARQ